MKQLLLSGVLACLLLSACTNSLVPRSERKNDLIAAREQGVGCFVKLKNGQTAYPKSLVLVTGVLKIPYLLGDGKKYMAADVVSYQTSTCFAISQDQIKGGHKSNLAVDALPGFALRTSKGRLNVYCKKYHNGKNAVDELFIQDGDMGVIEPFSCERMNEILKSDPAAAHIFNNREEKETVIERVGKTAAFYNQSPGFSVR